jgi:hypothetical protein
MLTVMQLILLLQFESVKFAAFTAKRKLACNYHGEGIERERSRLGNGEQSVKSVYCCSQATRCAVTNVNFTTLQFYHSRCYRWKNARILFFRTK